MYFYKEFKNSEVELIGGITWTYWTFGIQVHWNWITGKDIPDLARNCFALDFSFLCFNLDFDFWGKLKDEISR